MSCYYQLLLHKLISQCDPKISIEVQPLLSLWFLLPLTVSLGSHLVRNKNSSLLLLFYIKTKVFFYTFSDDALEDKSFSPCTLWQKPCKPANLRS